MKFNVSEITDVIKARRTIYPKDFTARKVHRELIEKILNNGLWAPNHGMTQPWRFKVFQGDSLPELAQKLADIYKSLTPKDRFLQRKFDNNKERPLQSSVVIAVCMEPGSKSSIPEIEEVEAIACAVQNMNLTATAYGLGTFWSTGEVIYSTELKEYLGLSEKGKCLGLIYIGYPNNEWPKGYRKPLEYFTEWRGKEE